MRILVTGNHGYIGSVLSPMLIAQGHEVIGLDTCYYTGCDFSADNQTVPTLHLDLRDITHEYVAGFDAIVHLAALSNDPLGDVRPELTHAINLQGTLTLAQIASEVGVQRFIFASSCSIYGASGSDDSVTEESTVRPLTVYAESKVRVEEGLARLANQHFSPVFMRNATAYGVSPRLRVDLVLNNLTGWAYTTGAIRILSDGTPWRPIAHIRDLSSAALAALEAPRESIHCQAFNVGAIGENYQVRDLAELVRLHMPEATVEYGASSGPDPRSYRVDFSKLARTFPDLKLAWNADRGVRELLAAYAQVNLTSEAFQGSKYIRLKRLRDLMDQGELNHDLRWTKPQGTHQ